MERAREAAAQKRKLREQAEERHLQKAHDAGNAKAGHSGTSNTSPLNVSCCEHPVHCLAEADCALHGGLERESAPLLSCSLHISGVC